MASYTYDGAGRLATTTDPLGRTDSLFYDTADRLIRQVLPGGREIGFAYDSSGNLISVTPPSQPAHLFRYTALDLDSVYVPPTLGAGTWSTQYRYDLDQQLTRILRPGGDSIVLNYQSATGRPSAVVFDRGTLDFKYADSTGMLAGLSGPDSTSLTFTYDGFLPKTVTWGGPVTGSVGVSYDSDFRVTSQTVNGGNSVTFGYDADGLLTAAGALGIKRSSTTGFAERDSLSGVLGEWSYDSKGALASYTASASGDTVFRTSYVRDSLSRITELTEVVEGDTTVAEFTYDDAGRLETVTRDGQLTASYEYDGNGNRLSLITQSGTVTGTYDDQDRMTAYGAATYSYARNGELAQKVVGTDTTWYTYDALGNLTQVVLPDGTEIEYVIDPQNRRVGKKVNGNLVQRFLWQGQLAPVAELDSTGSVVSRFVYTTRSNVPDYLEKGGETYRLVLDHLGSVRLVVKSTDGTVAQRIEYDEFGRVTQNTNPQFQPFGFAGGLYDTQTGLVRFGARDYDPETGRWTAKDPIGFEGAESNLYVYVAGDPVNGDDPTGLVPPRWGDEALEFYIRILNDPRSSPAARAGAYVGGFLASLWTCETWGKTATVLATGWGAGQWASRPFWRYVSSGSRPESGWLTRGWGWKPPYRTDFSAAREALQIPRLPTGIQHVTPKWYEPVVGPRRVFRNPQWGRGGGGWEYFRGWRFPD